MFAMLNHLDGVCHVWHSIALAFSVLPSRSSRTYRPCIAFSLSWHYARASVPYTPYLSNLELVNISGTCHLRVVSIPPTCFGPYAP
eukprot:6479784-Amphidinium_carterae.3